MFAQNFTKPLAFGIAAFAALPLFAQATGPQGLAEPKAPPASPVATYETPKPDPANTINIELSSGGTVSVQLRPDMAPKSVAQIKTLVGRHFYDGLTFHRVVDGFMAQGGDPKGDGSGGSDLPNVPDEINGLPHLRGMMAMARTNAPNSANSQFYIMLSANLQLDRGYTVIGRVVQGMKNVDGIAQGEPPPVPTKMVRVYIGAPPADPSLPPPSAAVALPSAPATLSSGPMATPAAGPARPAPVTRPVRR